MAQRHAIELTKKQFFALIKAVYIGNWIANAQTIPSKKKKNEYEKIENLVFSYADKFGYEKYVDHEEEDGDNYYPTRWFEEETDVHERIQDYVDDSFWDEFIDRMARLAMLEKYSKKEIEKFTKEEFFEELTEIEEEFAEEVEKYGLSRLRIDKSK